LQFTLYISKFVGDESGNSILHNGRAWIRQWARYFIGHRFQLRKEWGYRIGTLCPGVRNTGKAPRETGRVIVDRLEVYLLLVAQPDRRRRDFYDSCHG